MSEEDFRSRRDAAKPPRFVVGRDAGGLWVVSDRRGLCGGHFVNRADALRYARFESEGKPGEVALSSAAVRLEFVPHDAFASAAGRRQAA